MNKLKLRKRKQIAGEQEIQNQHTQFLKTVETLWVDK